jgi:hypothetical protein
MRLLILFTAAAICSCPAIAQPNYQLMDESQARAGLRSDNEPPTPRLDPWPVQLEMRVPFEPTDFPKRTPNLSDVRVASDELRDSSSLREPH